MFHQHSRSRCILEKIQSKRGNISLLFIEKKHQLEEKEALFQTQVQWVVKSLPRSTSSAGTGITRRFKRNFRSLLCKIENNNENPQQCLKITIMNNNINTIAMPVEFNSKIICVKIGTHKQPLRQNRKDKLQTIIFLNVQRVHLWSHESAASITDLIQQEST